MDDYITVHKLCYHVMPTGVKYFLYAVLHSGAKIKKQYTIIQITAVNVVKKRE